MTLADATLIAFTLCNSVRVGAYLPQVWKAAADKTGAKAVSSLTWSLFLVSHLSTAAYALVNLGDWGMSSVFLGNSAGCAAILLVTTWRRGLLRVLRRPCAGALP
jgi:hypothetical protein